MPKESKPRRVINQYLKKGSKGFDEAWKLCQASRALRNTLVYVSKHSKPSNGEIYSAYNNNTLDKLLFDEKINEWDYRYVVKYHTEILPKTKERVLSEGKEWKEGLIPNYKLYDLKPSLFTKKDVKSLKKDKETGEETEIIKEGQDPFHFIKDEDFRKETLHLEHDFWKDAPAGIFTTAIGRFSDELKGYSKGKEEFFKSKKSGTITTNRKCPNPPGYVNSYVASLYAVWLRIKETKGVLQTHFPKKRGEDKPCFPPLTFPYKKRGEKVSYYFQPEDLVEVRFVPQGGKETIGKENGCESIKIEFVYAPHIEDIGLDKERVLSIDVGLRCLLTCVTNDISINPLIIKGGVFKDRNVYYQKKNDQLKSIVKMQYDKNTSLRICNTWGKREKVLDNEMNLMVKYLIEFCKRNNLGKILIGWNKEQKQEINLGKETNRKFASLPMFKFRGKLKGECEKIGIVYEAKEESYTSKASFVDLDEIPVFKEGGKKKKEFSGIRSSDNVYYSKGGLKVHGDVNGALNILRKHYPDFYKKEGIEAWTKLAVSQPMLLDKKHCVAYLQESKDLGSNLTTLS